MTGITRNDASGSSFTNPMSFSTVFAGQTYQFSLPTDATLSELSTSLADHFHVPTTSQKLIHKGKLLLPTSDLSTRLAILFPSSIISPKTTSTIKLLLVGLQASQLEALASEVSLRERKSAAFAHHKANPHAPARSTKVVGLGEDDESRYVFMQIKPFPESVPCYEKRKNMLERLAKDEAVRALMIKRKYTVGVLQELHPTLQPTLLGLNKNAGEEISLRLLTNDLDGTRNYNNVRMVLLHELAHNRFSDHNNDFNELNSAHNKEIAAHEKANGKGSGDYEVWQPTATTAEEELRRTSHRLDEIETVGRRSEALRMGEEDLLDERRERVRLAAERRRMEEGR